MNVCLLQTWPMRSTNGWRNSRMSNIKSVKNHTDPDEVKVPPLNRGRFHWILLKPISLICTGEPSATQMTRLLKLGWKDLPHSPLYGSIWIPHLPFSSPLKNNFLTIYDSKWVFEEFLDEKIAFYWRRHSWSFQVMNMSLYHAKKIYQFLKQNCDSFQ